MGRGLGGREEQGPQAGLKVLGSCQRELGQGWPGSSGADLHHDQDTVHTSYRELRQLLIEDGVVVSYCERGARDNPWMESF